MNGSANTVDYYDITTVTAVKSFITHAPGVNGIKNLFSSSLTAGLDKLECFLGKFISG